MSRVVTIILLVAVLFVAISGSVAEAAGPGNGKGKAKGKAKGHAKTEQHDNNNSNHGNGSTNDDASGPTNNGNSGSSKTRKGLDDTQMNQNIYQEGDTLSYHVSNMHEGPYTIVVKKPGKGKEVVYTAEVYVDADGNLNVVLTDVPEDWSGPYQVQICGADGHCKNDNINVKKKHVVDLPEDVEEEEKSQPTTPEQEVAPRTEEKSVGKDSDDCITVVYHASSPAVTVVEFFRPEHASEPWMHEHEILGESRVDTEGAVVAHFAEGVSFVVFEYDEATGAYNYRGTGSVIGAYDELIHIWSDGDASSVLFDALEWTPVGASQ